MTDIVFVTSGLGHAMGGIGTASGHMVRALQAHARVVVVESAPEPSRIARGLRLCRRLFAASLRRPRLVLYEHRGLASIHALVPRLRHVPYVVLLHGYEVWAPLSVRQRATLEAARCLVANSQTTVDQARRHNPWLPDTQVAHLGVAVPNAGRANPQTEPLLTLVGRMAAEERFKGHDEVLDAWPKIFAAVPSARFVAIGGGNDTERLRRRVQQEGLQQVEFPGLISEEAKNDWLRRSRAAFAIGRVEGFGLANVEAAAMGIPLIGLAGTVLEELFPIDVGVSMVASLEPRQIAEAAIELLSDPAGADALGERGRQHVLAHYTLDHFARRYCDVMLSLLDSSPARARG